MSCRQCYGCKLFMNPKKLYIYWSSLQPLVIHSQCSHTRAGQIGKQPTHILVILPVHTKTIQVEPRCPVCTRHNQLGRVQILCHSQPACPLHVRALGRAAAKGPQVEGRIGGVGATRAHTATATTIRVGAVRPHIASLCGFALVAALLGVGDWGLVVAPGAVRPGCEECLGQGGV